jgi:hypothetical protein
MLKDIDIRKPLLDRILQQNQGKDFRIIPEMAVCDGQARVDIAVANGKLYGYEIKSDADTLDRLPLQKSCYDKTFDKIVIVVGTKYKDIIEQHIPDWWGIYIASSKQNGSVVLKEKRRAKHNAEIDAQSLLDLLWRDEVEELLKSYGFKSLSVKIGAYFVK